ncbi:MAG: trypsin-like serine protease [Pyrinomonadaceae bacterium]|nr:trypsin-like serine protease [Pyrinomonadaceae bacterium]
MSANGKCGCRGRAENEAFDAKLAYQRLAKKFTELTGVVTTYMSQAGLERDARARNAERMARVLERIVGGTPVEQGDFPECCVIGQRFSNGTFNWFCTGVLVHPRVVLTAAHCHSEPQNQINIVVALNAEDIDNLGNAEIVRAKRVRIHPNFLSTGFNDIGVIILANSASTPPVRIARTSELAHAQSTRLVGFGNDDIFSTRGFGLKREVEVPITNLRRDDDDDLDDAEGELGFESDLEFTAGGNGFDSCNGDSGGPAYILTGNGRKVAGLTSRPFTTFTNPCGEGGIYTRIDVNMDFVQQVASSADIVLP